VFDELGLRAHKRRVAKLSDPRLYFWIGEARIDLPIERRLCT
jgi:hypothetical protein